MALGDGSNEGLDGAASPCSWPERLSMV